jgi:predicted  nucleic acid-binding Zn-ribbon protein
MIKLETSFAVSTAPECELVTAEGKDSVLLFNPERTSSSNTNVPQMDEDTEQSNVDNIPASTSLPKIETKWESNCLSESLLIEENVALKKNLDILKSESQMKTVELSRVVEENRMLNSKLELTSETLNNKLELLDQLNEEFYELEYEYQEMTFQNDELRKELNALRDITATKCKDDREYSDLKKALGYLKSQNQQISQAYQAAVLSARNANDLARAREDANEILQSTVADLKTKLSTWQYEYDVLKEDEVFYRDTAWNSDKTIFQLGEEITGLKEELKSQEKSFSYRMLELGRVKDEFLNSSLDSVNESLAAKLTEKSTDDEQIRTTLLDLKNYEFEKEKTELRQHIEFLEKENQQMWKTRESAVTSAEKAEKLALEQVAALSEALNILQAAATHAKDARAATEGAEDVLGITDEAETDSKPSDTGKGNKFKNWFMKRDVTTRKPVQENEKIKLMRSTGVSMMENAKLLKEQAKNLKVKGKSLKKKAKKHLRK